MVEQVDMLSPMQCDELKLFLSDRLMHLTRLKAGETIEVRYGARAVAVEVDLLNEDSGYYMAPSSRLYDELLMVPNLPYKVTFDGRHSVTIGPVLGLLMHTRKALLNPNNVTRFVKAYDEVKGLVYCFAYDGIDWDTGVVEGYYWAPDGDCWVPGRFPLPSAAFRRTFVSVAASQKLWTSLPAGLVNHRYPFDKWLNYEQLMKCAVVKPHLRETELVKDTKPVIDMLSQYYSVYVKPTAGEKGIGVMRVEMVGDGFLVQGKNLYQEASSLEALVEILKAHGVGTKPFVVQATIPLAKVDGQIFDFRIMLQRSGTGEVVCTGIEGRLAKPQSVVSNIAAGGTPVKAETLICQGLKVNDKTAKQVLQKCVDVAISAFKCLELEYGQLGDIGVDIGLDTDGHPWIIECNPMPDHDIFIGFNNRMYSEMSKMPLKYISYLSGFPILNR